MADADIPMELFLEIGEAMIALSYDHFSVDSPFRIEVERLVKQAGDIAFAQLKQELPELAVISPQKFQSPYYGELLSVFFQVPAQLYAEKPHDSKRIATIEQAWVGLKTELSKDFFAVASEEVGSVLPELSDKETLREQFQRSV